MCRYTSDADAMTDLSGVSGLSGGRQSMGMGAGASDITGLDSIAGRVGTFHVIVQSK